MNKIDHTNLRPDATVDDIVQLCQEAEEYNFRGICVAPNFVGKIFNDFILTKTKIVTVIGFPQGSCTKDTKIFEAMEAAYKGADELDVVLNIGEFKSKEYLKVAMELSSIVQAIDIPIKVIVEECYYDYNELKIAHQIVLDSGASYIKTGTGTQGPATLETVKLWKSLGGLKIKAAGGIRTLAQAQSFLDAGVSVIGTSNGVEIMKEYFNL